VALHPSVSEIEGAIVVDSKYSPPTDVDVDVDALPVGDGPPAPLLPDVLVPEDEVVVPDPDVVDARDESGAMATQAKEGLPLVSAMVVRYWPVAQIGSVMQ
jgi:hypothetical protein